MGFLSIFSRKSSSNTRKVSGRAVKAQPYEATTASDAPFQGTYPVAGNGPNVLDTLSKSARFRQTQISLSASSIDPAAPPPTIPLHRESSISSRADVAPQERPQPVPTTSSKRRESFRGPPLSFRKLRAQPSLPSSLGETPEFAQHGAGFTQVFPPSHYAASHQRNSSMFSDGGKSVDVLDAHSEISHLDFRTRLQATGAKEYDEDVADRNLSQTTYDLDPSQVQAFYGTLPKGDKSPSYRDLPLTAVRRSRSQTDATPPSQQQLARAPVFSLFPDKTASDMAAARGADRMAGLRTYVPSGSYSVVSSHTPTKQRSHSLHRSAMPSELRRPVTAGSAVPTRPITSWGDSTSQDDLPPLPHYVPKRLEDLGAKRSKLPVAMPRPENQFLSKPWPATYRPSSSSRPGTSSNSGSVPSSALPSAPAQPSSSWAKCTRHALQLSVSSSSASGGSGELAGADSAPSPYVKPLPSRSDSRASAEPRRGHGYSRSRSMTLPRAGQLEEIYEHVPERGSSLRNWSLTSDTRSISSLSTNHFNNRPQSRHTANTSVDTSLHTTQALSSVSLPLSSARGSIYSTDHQGKLQLIADDAPPIPRHRVAENFTIDDYISSDDDSFIAPRRQRLSANEEHLLFRESGYGFAELPGLHDVLRDAAPAPPAILSPPPQPRQRPATSAGTLQHSFRRSRQESPSRGRRSISSVASIFTAPSRGRSRRRRPSTAAETSSLDQQEQQWPQSPPQSAYRGDAGSMRSRPSHRGRKGSQRLSAFGSTVSQTCRYDEDDYHGPAPEMPMSIRSTKSTMTTDMAWALMAEPAPPMPNVSSGSNSNARKSIEHNKNTTNTGDSDQAISEHLPVAKVDIAAVVRFRKLDKERRRTMDMTMQRGGKVTVAASTASQRRKTMSPMDTTQNAELS